MTAVWGLVLMAVALGATRLQDNVVNNALAIASFVTGILLGLFLLGILTRRVGQSAALVGMLAGVVGRLVRQVRHAAGLALVRPRRVVHGLRRRPRLQLPRPRFPRLPRPGEAAVAVARPLTSRGLTSP